MTNNLNYPFSLYIGKQYFNRQLLIYGGLALAFAAVFIWQCYSYLYGEYYYPQVILVMPFAFIAVLVFLIRETIRYKSKKPFATITQEGILFSTKPFSSYGMIRWENVTALQEQAQAESKTGRNLALYVENPDVYINAIAGRLKRRSFVKLFNNQGGALAVLNASMFNVEKAELKQIISDSIAAVKQNN